MKYLKKIWVRILLSLLIGGMLAEFNHIRTGDGSVGSSNVFVFIGAILSFSFFTALVWFDKYKYYFFPEKEEKSRMNEDIIDEDLD